MPEPSPEHPKGLVEAFKSRDSRMLFFYFAIAVALLVLSSGLIYQQLLRQDVALEKETVQSQRRVLVPGPRGNIYDRDGRLLVGNRPRFSAVLNLDELRAEFRREYLKVRRAYRQADDTELPNDSEIAHIARFTVVNRYLQEVNMALGREATLNALNLRRHFSAERLLPFTLIDDLPPEEYARLLEQLPVNSPLQVYVTSSRYYPYKSAAAHALGYVAVQDEIDVAEDFPGASLRTFTMKGSVGKNGLEARFDDQLQGEAGGTIYRIDPAGFRVGALERRLPVQGNNLVSSIDIDIQLAAEAHFDSLGLNAAAVMMDVQTGEVLALASKPDYDLGIFSPRLSIANGRDLEERGAWLNRAVQGLYPAGSSFKILVAIAGMRQGVIEPDSKSICSGAYRVGNRLAVCNNHSNRGDISLNMAIARSCNVFFYEHGLGMGPEAIAEESRRFGLGQPTGIELPAERRGLVPDPAWKRRERQLPWTGGDTTNFSIGQGDLLVTPVQMAAFTASFARGELKTTPTLVHQPGRPPQRTQPLGLTPTQYAAIVAGMEECTISGSARRLSIPAMKIPNLRIAGKTGTAQQRTPQGTINFAWFICFAPIEKPEIAIAIMIEGDTPGEETGGGMYAVPAAHAMLKAWAEKRQRAATGSLVTR
jgi:penicillin-binding protein 2